ncbi:MAG: hypothetical protein KKA73_00305 [Chloroflexi bacterium]|nr:hypothetical protein [Chloroflexota bacterium]MBU1746103.1 hypothetical protein [Chloroflexota bacterium]
MSIYPLELADAMAHQINLAAANADQVQAIVAAKQHQDVATYTDLYRQIIDANDWATLLATQAALEAAGLAEAPGPGHWTCPCCGRVVRSLVDCDWCEWDGDPADNATTCAALDQVRTGAGHNAGLGHGCMVCQECRPVFYGHPEVCPVQLIDNLVRGTVHPLFWGDDPLGALLIAVDTAWSHPDPAVTDFRVQVLNAAVQRVIDQDQTPLAMESDHATPNQ